MYFDFYTWNKTFPNPNALQDVVLPPLNPLTTYIDPWGILPLTMFFGMVFCLLLLARKYLPALGWPAILLWSYALGNALFILEFPETPYGVYNRAFEASAGRSFAEMLLIPLAAMASPKWVWKLWTPFLILDMGLVWFGQSAFTSWDMASTSFDTALMALLIPFSPWWLAPALLITILSHHGSTAFLVLLAELLAVCFVYSTKWRFKRRVQAWGAFAAACGFFLLLAYAHSNAELLDGSERLRIWAKYMSFPTHPWNFQVFGVGAGSFVWIAELMDNFGSNNFVWMLNDWLQIRFDLGWLGLCLAVLFFSHVVYRARKDAHLLAGVLGAAAFMGFYYPLRLWPTMFLYCLICNAALNKKAPAFLPRLSLPKIDFLD